MQKYNRCLRKKNLQLDQSIKFVINDERLLIALLQCVSDLIKFVSVS